MVGEKRAKIIAHTINEMTSKKVIVMPIPSGSHASNDVLEQYAMDRLSEEETASLEEHLLVCAACQEQQREMDDYVRAMRQALSEIEQESIVKSKMKRFFSFFRIPQLPMPAWAGVLAVIIALVVCNSALATASIAI